MSNEPRPCVVIVKIEKEKGGIYLPIARNPTNKIK